MIAVILLIAVASCTQKTTQQPNLVVAKTATPTVYIISTSTSANNFPRPPIPTLSIDAEQKMIELLHLSDCNLPCYMGITPGKTKLEDAKLMLESLDAVSFGESINGASQEVVYMIRFDDTSIDPTNSPTQDQMVLYDLNLTAINDVVQQIRIWILARGLSQKFQDYWSRYSPKSVFLQVGMPDEIYTLHGSLALVYKKLGIINVYSSFWKNGKLCPKAESYEFDRRFEITNKDSPIEIYSENENAIQILWQPIEESLGISIQEFYNQIIKDDSVCFDIEK